MTTAAIYLRQSLDKTGQEAAIQRQRAECEELCGKRGWRVVEVYKDNDTSASTGKARPAYRQLLRDVAAGKIGVVVAWHPDRLHRSLSELEDFIVVIETQGVKVETVRAGEWDLSTPSGRMTARILGSMARYEVEQKADRQRAGNRQRALAGMPHAGPTAFGYRREVVHDQTGKGETATLTQVAEEAEAVRQAYGRLLSGATLRGIAAELNADGFRTQPGDQWTGWTVGRQLKNPVYAGLRFYDGEQVATGNWTPIVTEETWRAAVALLEDPARRTSTDRTRRYLLPGLARCGIDGCGAKMATGRTSRGSRTYQCKAAKHLSRAAEAIDALVTAAVVARLSAPDAAELLLPDDDTPRNVDLREQAQALRDREMEAADSYAAGGISLPALERSTQRLRAEIAAIESQMQVSTHAATLRGLVGPTAAEEWESLPLDRRRAVVDTLMKVTLLPVGRGARTFRPESVVIDWRAA